MADSDICRDTTKLLPLMQWALRDLIKQHDLIVVETLRTEERQRMLLRTGKSKTMKSRHLLGMAADVMPRGGYAKWASGDWEKAHDDWDKICDGLGMIPERRISWDMGHFGMLGPKEKP